MQESLLSHIASNFISQYENVANSSVSYLLNKYPAARKVLKELLNMSSVPTHYITELSTKTNGRPDITGLDDTGNKIVIIEGKFWANLTDNQPENYLDELSVGGVLLFLVPDKRLKSLVVEIEKRLNGRNERIAIRSWSAFLELVEIENNKNHDSQLASDLMQLSELCKKMDAEGMPPLSMSDLDPMNGRLAYQFADIVDECNGRIRLWDHSDFTGLKTQSSKYGHGFYFKAYDLACYLYFSSYNWFTKEAHTPTWLSIQDSNWKKDDRFYYAINSDDAYNEKDHTLYAIQLRPGMDKNDIVDHIVNEVNMVLLHIKDNLK
ncbi:MAG TPA: hypothetical protein EYG78_06770 [Sulfurovum sp.]|nr:hypothetical protein [Sulfurovum sp.]